MRNDINVLPWTPGGLDQTKSRLDRAPITPEVSILEPSDLLSKRRNSLREKARKARDGRCEFTIAVIEHPDDIRNVGTVLRNVNALGFSRAYMVNNRRILPSEWAAVREHGKLIDISASASKWTFLKQFASTDDCLEHLYRLGFQSVVTSPHVKGATNAVLHEHDFTQYKKLAVWFGNESRGISQQAVTEAVACIQIPMHGIIESLNLGTASGIVMYEIAKQRRAYQEAHRERIRRKRALPA